MIAVVMESAKRHEYLDVSVLKQMRGWSMLMTNERGQVPMEYECI